MLKEITVKTLISVVAVALASIGVMQTDPGFAEEMRQLKLEARTLRAAPIGVVKVFALAETTVSPRALQFTFDDSDFSYYDKEEAYLQLGYDTGTLTLKLTEDAEGLVHSFPEIGRLNPEEHNRIYLEHHHALSLREKRDLLANEKARLRERVNLTQEDGSLELIHEQAYLKSVEAYYLDSMKRFGFEAQPQIKHANTRSYKLENGTHEASILFTRNGTDIRVRLSSLS